MADNILPDPSRRYFPETIDKTVEFVELVVEPGFYAITIRFKDRTSLSFPIEPCVVTSPVYEDWTSGESKVLKEYPPVRSEVSE